MNQVVRLKQPGSALLQCQKQPPHHILMVEDDQDIRRLNAEVLVDFGYQVTTAEDGAAGWDALNADDFDLLITDNNMPKVTGIGLLKKLRAARMALPVIMATGALPKVELTLHPWLQPNALLLKPYTIPQLLQTVKDVLRVTDIAAESVALPNWKTPPTVDQWRL